MKTKMLKKITLILIILVLSFISLVGIYTKNTNRYENKVRDYKYGMEFNGSRVVDLNVDLSEEEVEIESEDTESEEKEESETADTEETQEAVETSENEESKPKTQLVPINSPDVLTEANYKKVKRIIEKRLKDLSVQEYIVRQNKENGNIVIELPENDETNNIVSIITTTGKFEIIDAESKEVLLDNSNIESSSALYSTETNGTTVYLGINFNKEGKKILKDISEKYVKSEDEEGNDTTKKVTMQLDEQALTTTYFGNTIENGQLTLIMKEEITDTDTLQEYLKSARQVATIINNGRFDVIYKIENNVNVLPEENNIINYIKIIGAVIFCIGALYFIFRYKQDGIVASFIILGFISLLLLLIRYTNIVLSMDSIIAAFTISLVAYFYLSNLLKELKENDKNSKLVFNENLKKFAFNLIPLLILAIVFTMQRLVALSSFGMIMFWGIAIICIYLVWFAKLMLVNWGGKNEK